MKVTAVSKCLAGIPCRYDGKANPDREIQELCRLSMAVAICPECLGGMGVPRAPSEVVGGDGADVLDGAARVISSDGCDVTALFICGAYEALKICRRHHIDKAILKAKSPSCGQGEIYDGSFTGALRPGDGVTAALFKRNGIKVEIR